MMTWVRVLIMGSWPLRGGQGGSLWEVAVECLRSLSLNLCMTQDDQCAGEFGVDLYYTKPPLDAELGISDETDDTGVYLCDPLAVLIWSPLVSSLSKWSWIVQTAEMS